MPFQSEKQRRYLWANEPEIARDWTDTYGSRIEAALGGIMRLAQGGRIGYGWGGPGGKSPGTSAGPGPGGQGAVGQATQNPGVTGTTGTTGTSDNADDRFQNYAVNPDFSTINAPPGYANRNQRITHTPKTKGFLGKLGTTIKDYITGGGLIGMGIRGLTNVFGTKPTGWDTTMGPREDMGYNPNRVNPFSTPDRGEHGPPITPYLNDVYAQNVMEEDGLDIDTSTGNMQDWVHNFRVGNPYRQDKQGQLDPQITEMINNLYT